MTRKIWRFIGVLAVAAVWLFAMRPHLTVGGEAKEPAAADPARPAEFKPLDRWVGTWELEVTVKPGGWVPAGSKGTFISTIRWDLNGRFLRCEAKGQTVVGDGPKVEDSFLWISTYQPQRQEYQSWVFWSAAGHGERPEGSWGTTPVATGRWDEAKKTLTMTGEEAGTSSLTVTRWIDDDHHEFRAVYKDGAGQVMMEQEGKAKRKK